MKRKLMERINNLDEKEMAKINKELDAKNPETAKHVSYQNNNEDKASIITQDRLKKFNEIYGYENGSATVGLEELD